MGLVQGPTRQGSSSYGTLAQENIHENLFPLHDLEAKPNAESLQAIQEAEDFFVSGQKARFDKPEEVFDELGI